jgi:hypothetical protein
MLLFDMALAKARETVPTMGSDPADTILRVVEIAPEEDATRLFMRMLEEEGITGQQLLDFLQRNNSGSVLRGIIDYTRKAYTPAATPHTKEEVSFPDMMTRFDAFSRGLIQTAILEIPQLKNVLTDGLSGSVDQLLSSPKLKLYALIAFLALIGVFGLIVIVDGLGRLDPSSSHSMTPIYSLFD